ncbi:MAG: hypothetical protein IT372_42335 [Polyangiaceae bacterium]|nr:hypothetical protein [Polyangiaceae bacterium]
MTVPVAASSPNVVHTTVSSNTAMDSADSWRSARTSTSPPSRGMRTISPPPSILWW